MDPLPGWTTLPGPEMPQTQSKLFSLVQCQNYYLSDIAEPPENHDKLDECDELTARTPTKRRRKNLKTSNSGARSPTRFPSELDDYDLPEISTLLDDFAPVQKHTSATRKSSIRQLHKRKMVLYSAECNGIQSLTDP